MYHAGIMSQRAFRLRFLLDPRYLRDRAREIRSWDELARRIADLGRYVAGECLNGCYRVAGARGRAASLLHHVYYGARGGLNLAACRTEEALWRLRGRLPGSNGEVESPAPSPAHAAPTATAPAAMDPAAVAPAPLSARTRAMRHSLAAEFASAAPFRHVLIDEFLEPSFCRELLKEFPPYDAARFRNEHGHPGKAHREDLPALGPAFARLDALFRSQGFLDYMSELTGIPGLRFDPEYFGGGTHENLDGMELDPHVDFTLHPHSGLNRRVNLLLYLNPEWDPAWGGALELHVNPWRPAGEDRVQCVAPAFNRLVVFETSDRSWHGFQRIQLPAERKTLSRRSVALYLYTADDPRGILSIPSDLTVFVDRPLPERLRRPGHVLTQEDILQLEHLLRRRDWKLEYLYGRAIGLFNQWRHAKTDAGR